jgi:selenide,water dikinase
MKNNVAPTESIAAAVESMSQLNRKAAEAMARYQVSAVTDVTGYGLIGHAMEMAESSCVQIRLVSDRVTRLPAALDLAAQKQLTGGGKDNRDFCDAQTRYTKPLDEPLIQLLHDPQTSGGLLIAVDSTDAGSLLDELKPDHPHATIIGEIVEGSPGIEIV